VALNSEQGAVDPVLRPCLFYHCMLLGTSGSVDDYAILHKIIYGAAPPGRSHIAQRSHYISTSYIERQNLTMRTSLRRFTRLTNAFSKKIENHSAAIALYMMYYNFGRKRLTLGTTPALNHYLAVQQPYCSVTSAGRLQMG